MKYLFDELIKKYESEIDDLDAVTGALEIQGATQEAINYRLNQIGKISRHVNWLQRKKSDDYPLTTVGELIKALAQYPADMPVLVTGYESGYDTIATIHKTNVAMTLEDVMGAYESIDKIRNEETYTEPFEALIIDRDEA